MSAATRDPVEVVRTDPTTGAPVPSAQTMAVAGGVGLAVACLFILGLNEAQQDGADAPGYIRALPLAASLAAGAFAGGALFLWLQQRASDALAASSAPVTAPAPASPALVAAPALGAA